MFVAPLLRSSIRSPWLKAIAVRTTVAACIALVSSATNVIVLYVLDGKEMIWVCLGACGVDMVVNAIVLYWAMQGPAAPSAPKPRSIRFPGTPQHDTYQQANYNGGSCLEMGSVHKDSMGYPTTIFGYGQSQENVMSQGMTVTSSVCIPSLEEPEPALRSPHHAAQFGQHPWGSRSPLPPPAGEEPIRRSDSQRTSASLKEGGLVQPTAKDVEVYGPGYETIKYAEKSRRSSSTPPPPSQ